MDAIRDLSRAGCLHLDQQDAVVFHHGAIDLAHLVGGDKRDIDVGASA